MLFKKNGKLSKKGFELASVVYKGLENQKEFKIHTYHSNYSGGYVNEKDCQSDYVELCKAFNLKYELGNDAPRGGKNGNYILIKRDLRNSFFKTMKLSLEQPRQEKKEIVVLDSESLKEYFTKLGDIDKDIKCDFIKSYKESEELFILRKEYGINFKQSRIYIEEELECLQ